MNYLNLTDEELCRLIDNRWESSATIWDTVKKVTEANSRIYDGKPEWVTRYPRNKRPILSNRIFANTEAVINSLIANPPQPNVLESRSTEEAKKVGRALEKILSIRYEELNTKEVLRQGLRDLYFSRLLVLKPYWDHKINNFNVKRIDPNKVRFSKDAKNELESDFAIEEIETTLTKLIAKFPEQKEAILKQASVTEANLHITNPPCTYKETWIDDCLIVKYKEIILSKTRNPYWDWDGILVTEEELRSLKFGEDMDYGTQMKEIKSRIIKTEEGNAFEQDVRKAEQEDEEKEVTYESYLFNYFDTPRKPYIFATILNNEDKPIGRTSFIEQATSLQEGVERRKWAIDKNAEMVNGITKVDATVMTKNKAQALQYEPGGVIWGKNVVAGVQREFGQGLPAFVFEDMQDSRNEIDNIMAASSAFRGERQGQETKAGRLALIEQSFLRLNELVQVVDYVNQELFAWWLQLMKVNYTEKYAVKDLGADGAMELYELMQDDIEDGVEVRVIPGKSLPKDREFMFEKAQFDVQAGFIDPVKYHEISGEQNPKETAKSAFLYQTNPAEALGVQTEMAEMQMAPGAVPEAMAGVAPPPPPML